MVQCNASFKSRLHKSSYKRKLHIRQPHSFVLIVENQYNSHAIRSILQYDVTKDDFM